jgi:uncharacterized protein YndB with AHSA1/START domain
MINFTVTTNLRRPPLDVFTYVTDLALLPTWQAKAVSSVTDDGGPVRLGGRLREIHRAPGGKLIETLLEVCEYDPGRAFGLRVIEGAPIHLRIELDPDRDGTSMAFTAYGSLPGLGRIVEPLVEALLKRQFRSDCARLQRLLGHEPVHSARWAGERTATVGVSSSSDAMAE